MSNENVLVFPNWVLDEVGRFQGARKDAPRYINKILQVDHLRFMPRYTIPGNYGTIGAEDHWGFKQIIPYLVLKYEGLYFNFARTKTGGETRLFDKRSMGVGGHINDTDLQTDHPDLTTYMTGLRRELSEEVNIHSETPPYFELTGILNDDESPLGRVHFGVVYTVHIDTDNVELLEDSAADPRFSTKEELMRDLSSYETWGKAVIEELL
jgi:predicted NUDIX family phosphoesterase